VRFSPSQLHLGVNQLAHHALAAALAPSLAAGASSSSSPSRIVAVASTAASWPGAADALRDALDGAHSATSSAALLPWAPYAASKLANVAWCQHASSLSPSPQAGAGAAAPRTMYVAVHPGTAPSGLQRHMGALGRGVNGVSAAVGCSAARAAERVVDAATAREPSACAGVLVPRAAGGGDGSGVDEALAARVWAAGEAAVAAEAARGLECAAQELAASA
jgi:hypothetical protein